MALGSPPTVNDLGGQGCCYLAALLTAQEQRRLVAPTRRLAIAIMGLLHDMNIIDVPWPDDRWKALASAEETPFELLQWRLTWNDDRNNRKDLLRDLEGFLEDVPRDDGGLSLRLSIWGELAKAEAEGFFEHQLMKHRFDSAWAQDIAFVIRETHPALSIAQWRYCAWAATRHGASIALQQLPAIDGVREAVHRELRRRATRVASGQWGDCAFVPRDLIPKSGLGCIFTTRLARLGALYWMSPPAAEAIAWTDHVQSTKHVIT